ncbi:imelysin family protein [Marinomonas pollencensis]|uniref:Imelysin n=1 Tax=Marinomonas pollencensis TaxID=491954 RepID=A0A3E0DX57_9GAMM|nr:imelysin family protein [Marinomonas pollencensis]REG86671.1 imelysin [Marinomonas pollencensis]
MKALTQLSLVFCLTASGLSHAAEQDPYVAIYDKVIQANANHAVQYCADLQEALDSDSADLRRQAFMRLTQGWGRVQASYILGAYDIAAMDYPLMVDYFHMSKENIHESLARVMKSDSSASKALYKNSYKTLGALDDVMFSGPWSERRHEMADVISASVCKRLTLIRDGYQEHRADFLADQDKALSLLVNAEIENIYKTRDWRIAQISGLTKKTLGKPEPEHQQYPYSQASWGFIGAILATNQQLLADDQQPNVATIVAAKGGSEGLVAVQQALDASLLAYQQAPADHNYNTNDMIPLFQGLLDLQKAFYRQLVGRIGVTASLIDADGD